MFGRSIDAILEDLVPVNEQQRRVKSELQEIAGEYKMLREFAGVEPLMSDFRTAADMRAEINRLRKQLDSIGRRSR